MTTNEIVAVKDSILQLLGQGVEKATPLCEEIIRQYQTRALALGIVSLILISVGSLILKKVIAIIKDEERTSDGEDAILGLGGAMGLIMVVGGIIGFAINLANYFAPLCGLLGK